MNTIIEQIDKLKSQIEKLENSVEYIQSEIDDLQDEIDTKESKKYSLETQISNIEDEITLLETEKIGFASIKEQKQYYIKLFTDSFRDNLRGQFKHGKKWVVCNGYVLLAFNAKVNGINVVEGLTESEMKEVLSRQDELQIDFKTSQIDSLEPLSDTCLHYPVRVGTAYFNKRYLMGVKVLLNLNDSAKYSISCNNTKLIIEQDGQLALIVAVRV